MSLRMMKLENDTVVNVAQLLKEPVGAARQVDAHLDRLILDDEVEARNVDAAIRLTRVAEGVLADGRVQGVAEVECVRCLEPFEAPFDGEFDAEFRASVDVRTGEPLPVPRDDELFVIDHNHELDFGELLRQIVIISLPMQPICSENCRGVVAETEAEDDVGDDRFSALRDLLEEERQ